jgi:hypothetical protein
VRRLVPEPLEVEEVLGGGGGGGSQDVLLVARGAKRVHEDVAHVA